MNPTPAWLSESAAAVWAWFESNGFYVLALLLAIAFLYPRVKRRAEVARSKATDYGECGMVQVSEELAGCLSYGPFSVSFW